MREVLNPDIYDQERKKIITDFIDVLKTSDTIVNPRLLRRNHRSLLNLIETRFRNPEGIINWTELEQHIPPELKMRWKIYPKLNITIQEVIERIADLTKKNGGIPLTPKKLKAIDPKLYSFIQSKGYWSEVGINAEKKEFRTFEKAIAELIEILEQKNPPTFGVGWIYYNARKLYWFFFGYLNRKKLTWEVIPYNLPQKYKIKWRVYPNKIKKYPKIKSYEDQTEVDRLMIDNELSNSLYFSEPFKYSEEQNEIIENLIQLAQKGNSLAREKLWGIVNFHFTSWIETNSKFSFMATYFLDKCKEIFFSCVDNYHPLYPGANIFKYFYASIVYYSRKFQKKQLYEKRY